MPLMGELRTVHPPFHVHGVILPERVERDLLVTEASTITYGREPIVPTLLAGGYLIPGLVDSHAQAPIGRAGRREIEWLCRHALVANRHILAIRPEAPAVQQLIADILATWREAERLQAATPPGSRTYLAAGEAIESLRALYAHLTSSLASDGSPDAEHAAAIMTASSWAEGG